MALKQPRIQQWFKSVRKKEKQESPEITCGNCQTFYKGHYCPECGQPAKEFDRPFSFVIYDFLGNITAFDSRFFNTFWKLATRPGFLTKEFFAGRRIRYSPPFRNFIFLSFVMFLLLQYFTDKGLSKALENDINKGKVLLGNGKNETLRDSLLLNMPQNLDSILAVEGVEKDFNFDFATLRDSNNLKSSLLELADQLENKLEKITDPKKRKKYQTYIRLCRSPEQAMARILKYISYAFFLLLPIFALILKLFYIRRKQHYVRHLIFSIHVHSFWFLVVTIIMLIYLIFNNVSDAVPLILTLLCGVYFLMALKNFYKQGIGKTILKWIGISFIYYFVLWSVVMVAMLNALAII
ncbi:MAG: DUF3667 domain-containing protein [Prolixibacteraceae bacterium]|nr:DUF3667 domain-containing protein [Prolixibacteraceae bacterium]MBN2774270.1 DUF3667 domain-containing protein [Prolixibacteraceae bacterium]